MLRNLAARESATSISNADLAFGAGSPFEFHAERSSLVVGIGYKVAGFLIFLLLFVVLRHAQPKGIMLYQGIEVGFTTCVFQYLFEKRYRRLTVRQAAKNALLSFLFIYSFVFTVPVTVDRAYSVKMLTRLGESPSGLTRSEINSVFVDGFVAQGGVDRRIREQTATGSIQERGGKYVLTPLGQFLDSSFRTTRIIFACGGKK